MMQFTLMHGSGNNFVVLDNRDGDVPEYEASAFTQAVSRRGLGLGTDGVILIDRPEHDGVDFRWTYYNADGSRAEMCGNGAMCGARFAVEQGIAPARCQFEADTGIVEAIVSGDRRVSIRLPAATNVQGPRTLETQAGPQAVTSVTVGVPHAVVRVADADAVSDFAAWGASVRHHPVFWPDGANANLVHVIDRHTLRMRTFERGVEGETLACGTGAAASAVVGTHEGWLDGPVHVVTSSGLALEVDERADGLWLSGETRIVATGELGPDALA
jgi:diaminopimelate epimerase